MLVGALNCFLSARFVIGYIGFTYVKTKRAREKSVNNL